MDIQIKEYFNPTLPPGQAWMAHDDDGNYGFGRTPLDAIVALLNDEKEQDKPDDLPRCDCGSLFEICRYPNCECAP